MSIDRLITQFDTITSKLPGASIKLAELLDIALEEANIAGWIAERPHVPIDVKFGDRKLLVGHIDADHFAARPHKLGD